MRAHCLKQLPFPSDLLHPRHWLTWLGVGIFVLIAFLPWQWRDWLGQRLGDVLYHYHAKRRHVVSTNLRLCFPHLRDAERATMAQQHLREYASALLDYSVLFFRQRTYLYQRSIIHGREHFDNALQKGQNVILFMAHSVWLELIPVILGQHYALYGSYKPFKNPVINWLITRSRLSDVEFVVAREEGLMKLVRALKPGLAMVFSPDEDLGLKAAVFAPFFGIPKATLTTPARLAKLGKAVALPIMALRNPDNGQYEIHIGAALRDYPSQDEVQDATQTNHALMALITQAPTQYMWLLKLFRTVPDGTTPHY